MYQTTAVAPNILVVAVLPGPVTGMTLATQRVVEQFAARGEIEVFDIAKGAPKSGWKWRLIKSLRTWQGALRILRARQETRWVYVVANAGAGLWQTFVHVAAAKMRGFNVALHHQVYSYVNQHHKLMRMVQSRMTSADMNIVLSAGMGRELEAQYGCKARSVVLQNIFGMDSVDRFPAKEPIAGRQVLIGHLSNLTFEKGLDLAVHTFEELRSRGLGAKLILAGPCKGKESEFIKAAREKHGESIEYLGPLYGEDKSRFYQRIDVLLMPTRYVNEAQPLVIFEAMIAGAPVVAYDRGCIGEQLSTGGGKAISRNDDFVANAAAVICKWTASSELFAAESNAARSAAVGFLQSSQKEMQEISERMGQAPLQSSEVEVTEETYVAKPV